MGGEERKIFSTSFLYLLLSFIILVHLFFLFILEVIFGICREILRITSLILLDFI